MGNRFVIGQCVDCRSKERPEQLPGLNKIPCENPLQVKGERRSSDNEEQTDQIEIKVLDKDGNEVNNEEIENFLDVLTTLGTEVSSPLLKFKQEKSEGYKKLAESATLIQNLRTINIDFSESELINEGALINLGEILQLFSLLECIDMKFFKYSFSPSDSFRFSDVELLIGDYQSLVKD